MRDLEFEAGREYQIQLYPEKEITTARFIGRGRYHHIFECYNKDKIYVNSNWMKIENSVVTHDDLCYFNVLRVEKKKK